MSGIVTGTHLDRLLALRDRVLLEIETERRRLAVDGPREVRDLHPMRTREPDGPDPDVVRRWARQHGLTTASTGRISCEVLAAYHEAHPMEVACP